MKRKQIWGYIGIIGIIIIIFDSSTAFAGTFEGIEICIRTAIPSLFPFLVLSNLVTGNLAGIQFGFLRPIARLCGVPEGGESLLMMGLVGGYPIGAQAVMNAYNDGQFPAETAKRLLGFCNNAGPAFIFGMAASLFSSATVGWLLWGIQILSSLLVGVLLPHKQKMRCKITSNTGISIVQSLEKSIKTMGTICGWIVFFRIITCYLNRWFANILPDLLSIGLVGVLELSNGCIALRGMNSTFIRYIMINLFLSFGGLCVWSQTISVTKQLGTGMYLPGKLLQAFFSVILACLTGGFI